MNRSRLHGRDDGLDFFKGIGLELVMDPATVLSVTHYASVFQNAEME
jgi:hypothetical protein